MIGDKYSTEALDVPVFLRLRDFRLQVSDFRKMTLAYGKANRTAN